MHPCHTWSMSLSSPHPPANFKTAVRSYPRWINDRLAEDSFQSNSHCQVFWPYVIRSTVRISLIICGYDMWNPSAVGWGPRRTQSYLGMATIGWLLWRLWWFHPIQGLGSTDLGLCSEMHEYRCRSTEPFLTGAQIAAAFSLNVTT